MNFILKPFIFLWRLWFYISILIAIICLLPFIYITSLKPKWYRQFFLFARIWAWMVLILSGLIPKVRWHQRPDASAQYIIAPNHTSMVDIMLTLAVFPNCFLFIGKKELASMPIFGYFYKRTNLLVDRKSMRSRKEVFDRAGEKLKQGFGLCIFPEGLVPKDESIVLNSFKSGAFKLATEYNVPIIPVVYKDCKRHMPFSWTRGYPGILRVEVLPFLNETKDIAISPEELKLRCYNDIFATLNAELKQASFA